MMILGLIKKTTKQDSLSVKRLRLKQRNYRSKHASNIKSVELDRIEEEEKFDCDEEEGVRLSIDTKKKKK